MAHDSLLEIPLRPAGAAGSATLLLIPFGDNGSRVGINDVMWPAAFEPGILQFVIDVPAVVFQHKLNPVQEKSRYTRVASAWAMASTWSPARPTTLFPIIFSPAKEAIWSGRVTRTTGQPAPAGRARGGHGPGRPGWSPTQAPHRSGRVEQEAHLVTPPRPTSQVPIIGFSALLQLVEWYQIRLRRDQQGGSSCVDPEPPLSPPAPDQGSPSPQSAPALAQLDRRIPRANPGHPQSRRGPAARSASSHPGGDQ